MFYGEKYGEDYGEVYGEVYGGVLPHQTFDNRSDLLSFVSCDKFVNSCDVNVKFITRKT